MSPTPTPLTTEQRIAAAQQHILFERLPVSTVLSFAVALVFVALLVPFFTTATLLEWLVVIAIGCTLRLCIWYLHKRSKPPPQAVPVWARWFLLGEMVAAMAWSYGALVLMPIAGDVSLVMLVVALLAVSSVAVTALAAHLPSLFVFLALTLGPFGITLMISGGELERMVGLALLATVFAMTWAGYQGNLAIRRLLRTELDLSQSVMATAQARATAEEANRAKSRFLATMSHEIRTPLGGVLGLAEILQASSLTAEQRHHVDMLRRSGAHLLDIVNDILDFSKIEAEQLELARQDVNLRELIEDVAGPLRARVSLTGVAFAVEASDDLPAVILSDALRLRQILANLLSNAVKFTERGSIRLVVDVLDGKPADQDALLRFRVIDTGIGIPPERIGRVFDAFTQVDDSAARRAGGTGLGLAICRRLAGLLGGEVGAASEPGKGSTFVFTLRVPVKAWQPLLPNTTASGRYVVATRLRGRVLLAEDNSINLEVAGTMLSLLGLDFETAGDGQAAIDKVLGGEFDIVLMDCQMPGVDGYQATRELRRRDVRARNGGPLPIVALTANAFADDRRQAAAVGMDAFLPKPVQLEQLANVLARWLPVAESRDGGMADAAA